MYLQSVSGIVSLWLLNQFRDRWGEGVKQPQEELKKQMQQFIFGDICM